MIIKEVNNITLYQKFMISYAIERSILFDRKIERNYDFDDFTVEITPERHIIKMKNNTISLTPTNMKKLSVVIGRFQTPKLTEGHLNLIKEATKSGDALLILIGNSIATGTDKNPLNYEVRKKFIDNSIGECFLKGKNFFIEKLNDYPLSNKDWSDEIDLIVEKLGFEDATIFGGRDNSIQNYYYGKHKIKILEILAKGSATENRIEAGKKIIDSEDFRAGIIYQTQNRYPIAYSTVDIIIKNNDKYLIGKKGDKYCFIGGFVDTSDLNLQEAAIRELKEETGITDFEDINYCGSIKVEDERYKGTKDSIMTHCFLLHNPKDFGNEIQDKEFKDFIWATQEELEKLLHDFHKPLLTFIN